MDLGIGSQIRHPKFGKGVIVEVDLSYYKIYFNFIAEVKTIARDFPNFELVEKKEAEYQPITIMDIEKAMESVLRKVQAKEEAPKLSMAHKWINGTLVFNPFNSELSNKEISIKTFFHKIVMVREKLRVLEQNINNHPKLDDEERIHLQQYITRIYGSLTTFNVLFADKEDHFKGSGKED
ncbi:hypothetical protein A33Q_1556 [Indibacter alkaliphilus LW1]|uniref:Uncharacterized protein n=1 Tax=Indibacter alkaliphilus (strain CCUG 57479 / KCTC 22604 / LW1) TaxID=1189612 RepID=S2DGL5_INDAL|nr:hypothetical protein [Indibacter alkaliphilus]EOZ98049.1 hypothetical protein A33Q_1556 [Indibacter alkaliphilus LW1]